MCPQDILFSTQDQINNFKLTYPNCTQIDGNVTINGDDIVNLDGLNGINYIKGFLFIRDNDNLNDLTGLLGLREIGGFLDVSYNNSLTSLYGLNNIAARSITHLYIYYNKSLSFCSVKSICEYLVKPNGKTHIEEHNALGCKSPEEVLRKCITTSQNKID